MKIDTKLHHDICLIIQHEMLGYGHPEKQNKHPLGPQQFSFRYSDLKNQYN